MLKEMKNKAFKKQSGVVLFLCFFMMFFYAGLQTDQLNVLTPYYMEKLGWTATQVTNPVTYAGVLIVLVTFFVGSLFMKIGAKPVVAVSFVVLAVCTFGVGNAGDNYTLYFISLFLTRVATVVLQMGTMQLCTSWFVKLRGRALGLVTVGAPLETAIWVPVFTVGVTSALGFRGCYNILAGILVLFGVITFLKLKSSPEDCGMYPDGETEAPVVAEADEVKMTFKEVITKLDSWMLIISFGVLQFVIVAVLAFFVARMQFVGVPATIYLPALTIASVLGMPISYILGWIDDKFGTVKASLVLSVTFVLSLVSIYMLSSAPSNLALVIVAVIGIAGMTGGTPNLHPSITAYVFGRKNYQAANRWIMAIQAIMMALAPMFMSKILDARIQVVGPEHCLDLAYLIMLVAVVIAIVCLLVIGRRPDFDKSKLEK